MFVGVGMSLFMGLEGRLEALKWNGWESRGVMLDWGNMGRKEDEFFG
ncbi:MAG: hypothetical protein HDR06_20375 [Lachnospiraceae bacterium]|nr:hypothetical protein [Lachnospiraceae bacterium]